MAQNFVWGEGGEAVSTSSLAQRRKLAALLAQKAGSTDPIQHWTQGMARVADGIMAGLEFRDIKSEEEKAKAEDAKAWDMFAGASRGALGGSSGVPASPAAAPTPTEAPFKASIGPSVRDPEGASGDDFRSRNAMGGLDPKDVDIAVRTVLAEAGGEGPEGMAAVAAVLRNRAAGAGSTIGQEALKPNQFEPWNPGSGNDPRRFDPKSPEYQAAYKTILPVLTGQADDPTGGATHFYAPKAQAALGRAAPSWDNGKGRDLGGHRFFNLPYGGGGKHGTGTKVASADPSFVPTTPEGRNAALGVPADAAAAPAVTPTQKVAQAMPQTAAPSSNPNRAAVANQLIELGRANPRMRPMIQQQLNALQDQAKEERKAAIDAQRFEASHGLAQQSAQRAAESAARDAAKDARAAEEAPVKEASALRKEVQDLPSYKSLVKALPSFKSMTKAIEHDDQAADLQLVYGLAKIMDPDSVVRESEGDTIRRTDGFFGQLQGMASGVKGGAKLTPEVRASLMREAQTRVEAFKGLYDTETDGFFGGIADRRKLNRADIIPSYELPTWDASKISTIARPQAAPAPAAPAPAAAATAAAPAPAQPAPQAQQKPLRARNPQTGDEVVSMDGGQTWQPVPKAAPLEQLGAPL